MILSQKRGFTLIELLVVISIIGLLSSVVLSSVNTARARAADSRHIQALNQLKRAMELYYDNNGGLYPPLPVAGLWRMNGWDSTGNLAAPTDPARLVALAPYLPERPQGVPLTGWTNWGGYYYKVSIDRKEYKLILSDNTIKSTASIPLQMRDTAFTNYDGRTYASIYSSNTAKNWVWWD